MGFLLVVHQAQILSIMNIRGVVFVLWVGIIFCERDHSLRLYVSIILLLWLFLIFTTLLWTVYPTLWWLFNRGHVIRWTNICWCFYFFVVPLFHFQKTCWLCFRDHIRSVFVEVILFSLIFQWYLKVVCSGILMENWTDVIRTNYRYPPV